jgi:hypothetical protein
MKVDANIQEDNIEWRDHNQNWQHQHLNSCGTRVAYNNQWAKTSFPPNLWLKFYRNTLMFIYLHIVYGWFLHILEELTSSNTHKA